VLEQMGLKVDLVTGRASQGITSNVVALFVKQGEKEILTL